MLDEIIIVKKLNGKDAHFVAKEGNSFSTMTVQL